MIDEIYKALSLWGSNPVFVELDGNGSEIHINAEAFRRRIEQHVVFFNRLGIRDSVLVPIFIDNCWDYPAIFLALVQTAAIPVLLKKSYKQLELEAIFNDTSPSVIICDDDFIPYLDLLGKQEILLISRKDGELTVVKNGTPEPGDIATDTVSVNFTYRGFGYPLGAMISENGYLKAARRFQDYVRFTPGDRILALLPMNHIFTMISSVFLPLLNQITTYIPGSLNPKDILQTLKTHRINYLSAIPEILILLTKIMPKEEVFPSLQVLISGGSFLSRENHQNIAERFKVEVLNGYGLTEIAPLTGNIREQERFGTIGKICNDLSMIITESPDSQNGEILVEAEKTFLGYLGRPSETAAVMDGKWFKTGDTARMEDGYLIFTGELKPTRKVNGQIVDFREVEKALLKTGLVDYAKVNGETNHIVADVRFLSDYRLEEREQRRELRKALKGMIAEYKIPRIFRTV